MPDNQPRPDPLTVVPDPTSDSPEVIRAHFHALVDVLPYDVVLAHWRLLCCILAPPRPRALRRRRRKGEG